LVVEYIRYSIGADRADAFLRSYEIAANSLRQSLVCLAYELSRCSEAPEAYILRIEWESTDAHLKGFRVSAEFKTFFEAIKPYIKDIEEMRHYEPTAVLWRR
jgi:quinol monooxygenase YgiN